MTPLVSLLIIAKSGVNDARLVGVIIGETLSLSVKSYFPLLLF